MYFCYRGITSVLFVLLCVLVVSLTAGPAKAQTGANNSAVVLMYHRFGEADYPSTNITLAQFEAHIEELLSGDYTVLPLEEIVTKMQQGISLPNKTIGLSIDDAYVSTYQQAWPRLKKAGLPFTVFVSAGRVGRSASYMNWDQIREMSKGGVSIGNHTVTHLHMPIADAERNLAELQQAEEQYEKELGIKPQLMAYPYGETSLAVESVVRKAGFKAAFGQHSGAFDASVNSYYLPRFALSEKYGNIERFKVVANTLSIPVTDITPADPLIGDINPPAIGFTALGDASKLENLSCFISHVGKARIERLGTMRFEIWVDQPMPTGRSRLSCTYKGDKGRYHWMGRQFYNPQ